MAINTSARNYKFFVNGKDYTAALIESNNWSTNSIDQSGLIKTSASFTLAEVRDLPGSLDDRINTDWNVGKSVLVQVADSTGILRNHPCGNLRILSSSWDYESRRLQINCGCLISLLSFRAPTDPINELELEPATLCDRSIVVSNLLTAAGITAVSGNNSLPYPLYFPFNVSGSYLETAGKILYAALRFGRIDSNEVFVIEPITLNSSSAISWTIGSDSGQELWYRRLSSNEAPREIIEVRGNRQVGETPKYPIKTYSERYGDPRFIDPELIGGSVTLYEQLNTTENYSFESGILERIIQKYEPIGLIIPATTTVFKTSLIESLYEVTTYRYATDDEGKLVKTYGTIYRTQGEALKEYYEYLASIDSPNLSNASSLIVAETYTIEYFYDTKDRANKIITTRYKTRGELLSGLDTDWAFTLGITPLDLSPAENTIESWVKQSNGFWIHKINTYKTLGVVNPGYFNAQVKPELMTDETFEGNQRSQQLGLTIDNSASINELSNSGQTVPPAAERRPPKVILSSEEVCGKAVFSLYGGNPYKEKERSYSVEYLGSRKRGINEDTGRGIIEDEEPCDDAQSRAIAQIEGALLAGRFKGQDIGVDIKDALFSFRPLMNLNCTEPGGTTRSYALDDSHWYLGQNRAIANFGAIWLGDIRQGNLRAPYTIATSLSGTINIGGNIRVFPYGLVLPIVEIFGGFVVGGDITRIQSLPITGRVVIGGVTVGGNITIQSRLPLTGGVVIGGNVTSFQSLPTTSSFVIGGVTVGGNITVVTPSTNAWNSLDLSQWNSVSTDSWNSRAWNSLDSTYWNATNSESWNNN